MPNFFGRMETTMQRELENRLYGAVHANLQACQSNPCILVGNHSLAKWLERHAYDYFHADAASGIPPGPTPGDSALDLGSRVEA